MKIPNYRVSYDEDNHSLSFNIDANDNYSYTKKAYKPKVRERFNEMLTELQEQINGSGLEEKDIIALSEDYVENFLKQLVDKDIIISESELDRIHTGKNELGPRFFTNSYTSP